MNLIEDDCFDSVALRQLSQVIHGLISKLRVIKADIKNFSGILCSQCQRFLTR